MRKEKRLLMVQAMEKTLELLEILAIGGDRLTIGVLADKLQVSRNNALLLLVTLESRDMVRWDGDEKVYRPGFKSVELAKQFNSASAAKITKPRLPAPSIPQSARKAGSMKLRPERRIG